MTVASISRSSVAAPPKPVYTAFAAFLPTRLTIAADGSPATLEGMLNKSYSATVRYANGQFTSSTRHFLGATTPAKPLTKNELSDLHDAVRRHMANTPGRQPDYEKLAREIRKGLTELNGPAKVDPAKIPTSILGPNAGAQVESELWVNLMPTVGAPGPASVIGSVSVFGTGFNDARPNYNVTRISIYEKTTGKLIATFPKPAVQGTEGIRGMQRQSYRVEFPVSKIDMSKQYTVVAETSINGAPAKLVRSEFGSIGRVY